MVMKSSKFWRGVWLLVAGFILLVAGLRIGMSIAPQVAREETAVSATLPATGLASMTDDATVTPTHHTTTASATAITTLNPTTTLASTPLPTLTQEPVATPTATPTPIAWFEQQVLGHTVQNRPIEAIRLGHGERWFVLLGALHGEHECHTTGVVEGILEYFITVPERLPAEVTLYAIPLINQDGCVANTRNNANGVDLNRNWDTPDWQADAEAAAGVIVGSGGSHPFSEPETRLLRDWLLLLQENVPTGPLAVISYHSAVPPTGLAQPGYLQMGQSGYLSGQLALCYSEHTGYRYSEAWVGNYAITGELIHWANLQGIVAMDVELPDRRAANTIPAGWAETHIETNLRGVLAALEMIVNNWETPDPSP